MAALDAARGYALLGVAVVNVHAFSVGLATGNYAWDRALTWYDQAAELISNLVFAHRSLPMLAFLLGVGLVVQTRALERAGVGKALFGRYFALLLIGIAHGVLLWPGEILAAYALMVLLLARFAVGWSDALLKLAIGLLIALSLASLLLITDDRGPLRCQSQALLLASSFAQPGWLASRVQGAIEFFWVGLLGQVLIAWLWLVVLLGVWCGRRDAFWKFLDQPSFRHPVVASSAAILVVSTTVEWITGRAGGWSSLSCGGSVVVFFSWAETITALASVPVLLTLFAWLVRQGAASALMTRVQAVGRAPLTMFIGQSIVFALLFNQSVLGLHGRLDRVAVLVIAVTTYFALAEWIARRYVARGLPAPGERFWRGLTARLSAR